MLPPLANAIDWLRALNACHHNIVGRPVAARHALIDDLSSAALEVFCRQHRPAAVVVTSPGNLQVWLTLSAVPVEPALAEAAAKLLAAYYSGDLCAARATQPSRIPGLSNRKPKRLNVATGLYLYALLLRADGPAVDPAGAALLEEARAMVARAARATEETKQLQVGPSRLPSRSPADEHGAGIAWLQASLPPGVTLDRSRADYAIARR
jgi:hypothetical protein